MSDISTQYYVEAKHDRAKEWTPLHFFATERDAQKYLDGLVYGPHSEPGFSYRITPKHSILGTGRYDGP